MAENVIIMGAAGRDFHNFNMCYRGNEKYHVIAFTATQIPDIEGRFYPPELAGHLYPDGIPIFSDIQLESLIREFRVDHVAFSYSDIQHREVMHKASIVNKCGADFRLIATGSTMLKSNKKIISVCAVRTGCGKSQTSRQVYRILRKMGKSVVLVRHPMPYGDLKKQVVQRFSTYQDFESHNCTIEEREEYEPVIEMGAVIFAGTDYLKVLKRAEKEADYIIWDGGNNDTPFFKPDLNIVVFDPHRAGHETSYHPGEINMLMADIAVINKVTDSGKEKINEVRLNIEKNNPDAVVVLADSEIIMDDPDLITGKRVLVVEDGPTLTHGEMSYGAGVITARRFNAAEIVDPRPFLAGSIKDTFKIYPKIGKLLPAMGYNKRQVKDLEKTINNTDCDLVLFATTVNLTQIISINKPSLRIMYEYDDYGDLTLEQVIREKLTD